jgi:hypothetical protein
MYRKTFVPRKPKSSADAVYLPSVNADIHSVEIAANLPSLGSPEPLSHHPQIISSSGNETGYRRRGGTGHKLGQENRDSSFRWFITVFYFQLTSNSLSLMTNLIEAEIVKMHLAHLTYDKITVQLGVRRSRISRTIRAFHQSGIIPAALRIGRP